MEYVFKMGRTKGLMWKFGFKCGYGQEGWSFVRIALNFRVEGQMMNGRL